VPSAASVDNAGIVIETIKRAEDGQGIILRLYESLGSPTTASLRTTFAHRSVRETNLMEIPSGPANLDRLDFTPFEIKTLLLEG
jgi:alpha-mannosidase